MCGIAGLIRLDGQNVDPAPLGAMVGALHHRGPDARGELTSGPVALGHARLSILDLKGGAQPMSTSDGKVSVTYNGEIYNYPELKQRLIARGATFQTSCDTEVLLHLWRDKGPEMVHDLWGMFSFVIHDENRRQAFAAVDRFGQKPFYYRIDKGVLAFASEPNALKTLPDRSWTLDPASVHHYLSYLAVPHPRTIWKDVSRLAGGRRMIINLTNGTVEEDLWYHLDATPGARISYQEAQDRLRELLTDATRRRLMSDVPLGSLLSGGIDSTIVTGLASGMSSTPLKTFTIGVDSGLWDESDEAALGAKHLGTDHHVSVVNPCDPDELMNLVRHLGEPFADSSILPTGLVCKLAREHVTVALSGDAADEAFSGYNRYLALDLIRPIETWPRWLRRAMNTIGQAVIPGGRESRHRPAQVKRLLAVAATDGLRRYQSMLSQFTEGEKHDLYGETFFHQTGHLDSLNILEADFARSRARSTIEQAMDLDINRYLQDDILVKIDRASMRHSLELRSPFIDHRVIEFAFSLPLEYKRQGRRGKRILRDTFADLLPPGHDRLPKRGFAIPLGQWFRGPLKPMMTDLLSPSRVRRRGLFNGQAMDRLLREHDAGHHDHGQKLWALCVLEMHLESAP